MPTDAIVLRKKVFTEYPRAVVHLREQRQMQRFGLVLGAGISKSLNVPGWGELIDKLSSDPDVDGQAIHKCSSGRSSLPYKTELLYQHFRQKEASKADNATLNSLAFENRVSAKWLVKCGEHLYRNTPSDFDTQLDEHPYLSSLIPLIQSSPLTVTYNFDDYIERALELRKAEKDKTRGFETVTNPWNQFRRRDAVVYHPNGVIPRKLMERPRDKLVFSESSFAEQFMGSLLGDNAFLINHFSKTTCLLIGLSLEDETLRSILIQNASQSPGNLHYYIHFLSDDEHMKDEEKSAIREANFKVYNLLTLFLQQAEIAAFAELIDAEAVSASELGDLGERTGAPLVYRFYLTGSIGAGKTTTASQLQSLSVVDEWMEPRLDVLAKPWDTLTKDERTVADEWILEQFRIKNDKMRHAKQGIFVVDRPPLDPLAFTEPENRSEKAGAILQALDWPPEEGAVIRLVGNPDELAARVAGSGRDDYKPEKLAKMQRDLDAVYGLEDGKGYFRIDTKGMSAKEVTKCVAHIIHMREYAEYGLDSRLKTFSVVPNAPTPTSPEPT